MLIESLVFLYSIQSFRKASHRQLEWHPDLVYWYTVRVKRYPAKTSNADAILLKI